MRLTVPWAACAVPTGTVAGVILMWRLKRRMKARLQQVGWALMV
jgi:hypothetical protein